MIYTISGYRRTGKTTKLIDYVVHWRQEYDGPIIWRGVNHNNDREIIRQFRTEHGITVHPWGMNEIRGRKDGLLVIDEYQRLTEEQMYYVDQAIQVANFDLAYSLGFE